jgi:CheY-like chemotaxis protein
MGIPRMKALLVEDELLVREVAYEDLMACGFEVTAASDADEALALLDEDADFDLLFTDIRMPGSADGWEVARVAKTRLPGLRVIYATGLGDASDGLAESELIVRKPYSFNDLKRALETLGLTAAG